MKDKILFGISLISFGILCWVVYDYFKNKIPKDKYLNKSELLRQLESDLKLAESRQDFELAEIIKKQIDYLKKTNK